MLSRSIAPQAVEKVHPESGVMRRAVVRNDDLAPYMALVHQEVTRILRRLPPSVQKGDLMSAATQGLMDALQKTATERGPQFEWYARIRIRGAVLDQLRSEDWLSRTARSESRLRAARESQPPAMVIGFDDLPENKRSIPAPPGESPFDFADRKSERMALSRAIAELPQREATIIEMHYVQGIQFKDIAAHMKVSEPRIAQLHARAVALLRGIMSEQEAS
jgi:RNA polymerase sigma factor for flagellar operon FliA